MYVLLKEKIIELIKEYNIEVQDLQLSENIEISGISTFYNYKPNTITWLKNKEIFLNNSIDTEIEFIILAEDVKEYKNFKNYIVTKQAKELFFLIIKYFFSSSEKQLKTENKNSIISSKAKIADNVIIGNYCTIEDNVSIGKNTIIGNNVTIKNNTIIGENCVIQSGAIIGEDGFGFIEINNKKIRVAHLGGVQIGNFVEIGANTCIIKGTIDNTIIENNVKIDNLCHIAHNIIIKENTAIVAQTLLGGSVKIGENCWISTSAIRNQINIGKNSLVGLGSVVVKDVPENSIVYGNPAKKGIKK